MSIVLIFTDVCMDHNAFILSPIGLLDPDQSSGRNIAEGLNLQVIREFLRNGKYVHVLN
jgi:hypothetical protein